MLETLMSLACGLGVCGATNTQFDALPLEQAIVYRQGSGEQKLAVFTDIGCEACHDLHRELKVLKDTTVYVFLLPITASDSKQLATSALCSGNPAQALDQMMEGARPSVPACDAGLERYLQLGRQLGFKATPALVVPSGKIKYGSGWKRGELAAWTLAGQQRP